MTDTLILTLVLCVGMSVVLPVSALIIGSTLRDSRVPEAKETLRAEIETAVARLESKLAAQHSEMTALLRSHEKVHHSE